MRKSVVASFIVAAAAIAAFAVGWIQFAVPPGSYGVLRSKTGGVDPRVLRNGDFRWAWERLLPTNAAVAVFTLASVEKEFSASGSLPNAAAYAPYAGADPSSFSYDVAGRVSFSLRPDSLPALVSSGAFSDQASLDAWLARTAEAAARHAVRRLHAYAEDPEDLGLIAASGTSPRLLSDLERAFPDAENVSVSVSRAKFPDYALYGLGKKLYAAYVEQKGVALEGDVRLEAAAALRSRARFEELEKYGELLAKYPSLLHYLAIEKGAGADVVGALPRTGD